MARKRNPKNKRQSKRSARSDSVKPTGPSIFDAGEDRAYRPELPTLVEEPAPDSGILGDISDIGSFGERLEALEALVEKEMSAKGSSKVKIVVFGIGTYDEFDSMFDREELLTLFPSLSFQYIDSNIENIIDNPAILGETMRDCAAVAVGFQYADGRLNDFARVLRLLKDCPFYDTGLVDKKMLAPHRTLIVDSSAIREYSHLLHVDECSPSPRSVDRFRLDDDRVYDKIRIFAEKAGATRVMKIEELTELAQLIPDEYLADASTQDSVELEVQDEQELLSPTDIPTLQAPPPDAPLFFESSARIDKRAYVCAEQSSGLDGQSSVHDEQSSISRRKNFMGLMIDEQKVGTAETKEQVPVQPTDDISDRPTVLPTDPDNLVPLTERKTVVPDGVAKDEPVPSSVLGKALPSDKPVAFPETDITFSGRRSDRFRRISSKEVFEFVRGRLSDAYQDNRSYLIFPDFFSVRYPGAENGNLVPLRQARWKDIEDRTSGMSDSARLHAKVSFVHRPQIVDEDTPPFSLEIAILLNEIGRVGELRRLNYGTHLSFEMGYFHTGEKGMDGFKSFQHNTPYSFLRRLIGEVSDATEHEVPDDSVLYRVLGDVEKGSIVAPLYLYYCRSRDISPISTNRRQTGGRTSDFTITATSPPDSRGLIGKQIGIFSSDMIFDPDQTNITLIDPSGFVSTRVRHYLKDDSQEDSDNRFKIKDNGDHAVFKRVYSSGSILDTDGSLSGRRKDVLSELKDYLSRSLAPSRGDK
jgi:hypothetical protein